jgi:hypothetical protein
MFHLPPPFALAMAILLLIPPVAQGADVFPLWTPKSPVPSTEAMKKLKRTRFHIIQDRVPERDGYNWLHGVALAFHKSQLYSSFGHNTGSENTAGEEANGRISLDLGKSWLPRFQMDHGSEPTLAVSHGVFLSEGNRLWAFHGAFYRNMEGIHTRAYLLDDVSGEWEKKGSIIEEGFWPMQEPQELDNGHWIMAGLKVIEGIGGANNPAAVALCDGSNFEDWKLVDIPRPSTLPMWGESTVIHQGKRVLCIARYRKPIALVSESNDFGETWSETRLSNLPMSASKPYAGRLSTGHCYLIGNISDNSGNKRAPLTIALSKPGTMQFNRVFSIREAQFRGPGESHENAALAYPYAVEHNKHLYVAYSNNGGRGANRNSAELAVISIEELTEKEVETSP